MQAPEIEAREPIQSATQSNLRLRGSCKAAGSSTDVLPETTRLDRVGLAPKITLWRVWIQSNPQNDPAKFPSLRQWICRLLRYRAAPTELLPQSTVPPWAVGASSAKRALLSRLGQPSIPTIEAPTIDATLVAAMSLGRTTPTDTLRTSLSF